MDTTRIMRRPGWWKVTPLVLVASMIIAACSSSNDSASEIPAGEYLADLDGRTGEPALDAGTMAVPDIGLETTSAFAARYDSTGESTMFDAKVIRDGRVDIRIPEGSFDVRGSDLRALASELGGYVSSGESHLEELEENRYAVGWFTLRIPSERFEAAVARVEGLGERISSSLSSQDVSDQYVDLEGRLRYWRQQEVFYTGLLSEAQDIDDLVAIQVQMQDVLLNIEQIEGQLQYLDGRTSFASLTVGLTEVPDEVAPPVVTEPGTIAKAFEQAGEVLLATVAFLIVAAAVVIPVAMLALLVWLIFRLFNPRRKERPAEG
ncbi:MAG: DUF4349 domain-containing protein [Acidimicrobiia bacterium]